MHGKLHIMESCVVYKGGVLEGKTFKRLSVLIKPFSLKGAQLGSPY